jgi:hypothetical protein
MVDIFEAANCSGQPPIHIMHMTLHQLVSPSANRLSVSGSPDAMAPSRRKAQTALAKTAGFA